MRRVLQETNRNSKLLTRISAGLYVVADVGIVCMVFEDMLGELKVKFTAADGVVHTKTLSRFLSAF